MGGVSSATSAALAAAEVLWRDDLVPALGLVLAAHYP